MALSTPASDPTGGRTFYIDSTLGNDASDGRAATPGSAGSGPYRTLARMASAGLAAGDTVVLACGSTWNETLVVPVDGTATRPVTVRAPAAGCSAAPTIDGSITLPATAWVPHSGSVWRTTLATTPLQLWSTPPAQATSVTAAQWSVAHHPNRGWSPADPTNPFLPTAYASDGFLATERPVSNWIVAGSDLVVPGGEDLAGARIHIRTYPWWMDESTVASQSGNRLMLAVPTWYPVGAGWGYYLSGQAWMVDSPGEWHHDAATGRLLAHMPGGVPPTEPMSATVLATGINLQARSHVVVQGLAVRRTGTAVDLRGSVSVQLRGNTIEDTVAHGADATASTSAIIDGNAFVRIGLDAVSGWRHNVGWALDMVVSNNLIRDSGVLMEGDTVLSQPLNAMAAIHGGERGTVRNNTIINAAYIGILVRKGSTIEGNFVYGTCSVLDDCAGIFLQYAGDNGIVRGNTVVHSRGALAGRSSAYYYTQGQGIYLDESASGILVEDNTVIDADHGILLHVASRNTVRNNRLYGNRLGQLWMQATRNNENPAGDLYENSVTGNQIAAVYPASVGLRLDTIFDSTAGFGTVEGNRYHDRNAPAVVRVSTAGGTRAYTFGQWQRSTATDLPAGRDSTGTASSQTGYAGYAVSGTNLVYNGGFGLGSTSGWQPWNATLPLGQLLLENCSFGPCARYVAGGSAGLISTHQFSTVAGQWYRLTLDLATEQDNQTVRLVVRRGGGGNNGYESVIDRDLSVNGSRTWRRYSLLMLATTTVTYRDPVTGDLGARIDIEPVGPGATISVANVELVPVVLDGTATLSGAFINAGSAARAWACPFTATLPVLCDKLRTLADDQPVQWPLTVPARGATILYAQEPTLLDSDGDGIADLQDACPGTAAGLAVNARGCALGQ